MAPYRRGTENQRQTRRGRWKPRMCHPLHDNTGCRWITIPLMCPHHSQMRRVRGQGILGSIICAIWRLIWGGRFKRRAMASSTLLQWNKRLSILRRRQSWLKEKRFPQRLRTGLRIWLYSTTKVCMKWCHFSANGHISLAFQVIISRTAHWTWQATRCVRQPHLGLEGLTTTQMEGVPPVQ